MDVYQTHNIIIGKFSSAYEMIANLKQVIEKKEAEAESPNDKAVSLSVNIRTILNVDELCEDGSADDILNIVNDYLLEAQHNYNLEVMPVIVDFYNGNNSPNLMEYYLRAILLQSTDDCIAYALQAISEVNSHVFNSELPKKNTRKRQKAPEDYVGCGYGFSERSIDNWINKLQSSQTTSLKKEQYDVCDCGEKMETIAEVSQLKCLKCGETKKISGVVFKTESSNIHDTTSRSGGYVTARHYKIWIERIQALESVDLPTKVYTQIDNVIRRDNYTKSEINCKMMRTILKQTGNTSYNPNVPYIVKLFGGTPPPILSYDELKITSMRFNKVIELYLQINPNSKNSMYYPYFLHKIFEQMFAKNPEKKRILQYIHLQEKDTLIKADRFYAKICAKLSHEEGFIYTPTIRS